MKLTQKNTSFFRRFHADQRGQMIATMAVMLPALLGMSAFSIDVGHAYVNQGQLQSSTNAAALAGAQALAASGSTAAVSTASNYSAGTGDNNTHSDLNNVAMVSGYPKAVCLSSINPVPCTASSPANAVVVQQTATVRTYFGGLIGRSTLNISATAKASMGGIGTTQYNVAIVVDTTASMNSTDSGSGSDCNNTRIACSLQGVQTLLSTLSPCVAGGATCGTQSGGTSPNPFDRVSLFTFPNLATPATATLDYDCLSTNPVTTSYSFPAAGATSYAPTATQPTYEVLGFQSDYRASDSSSSLNTAANIVKAAGGKSGCSGMAAPGGAGTYYAGVIYAAQSALTAAAAANTGTKNVLIILSDGDASSTNFNTSAAGYNAHPGVYPSNTYQCSQAVTAAQAAATAGTRVYSVAYGSGSSGCSTDNGMYTPCSTMKSMASDANYFYSDYTATGGDTTCTSAAQPTSSLNEIFTSIANGLTSARLIPNSTT